MQPNANMLYFLLVLIINYDEDLAVGLIRYRIFDELKYKMLPGNSAGPAKYGCLSIQDH